MCLGCGDVGFEVMISRVCDVFFVCICLASPAGIEPALRAPQARVLSVELRRVFV